MAFHSGDALDVAVGRMRRGDLDEVEDYAHREETLAAAGAVAPQWA